MAVDDAELLALAGGESSSDENPTIMALPEIEREAILADRAQTRERKNQDQHLRKLLQAREADAKASKRKAPADLDESPRKSTRQKTTLGGRNAGEASKMIEDYKRQRKERGLKSQQRKAGNLARQQQRPRSSDSGSYSSADASGESAMDWEDGKTKAEEELFRTTQPGDYNDFRRITLSRFFLAEFCFTPGFEEKIRGCYVRLPQKSATSGTVPTAYQLVQIQGVIEKTGWFYAMMRENGKKFATNLHLMLGVDGSRKEFHMNAISNTIPSEVEVANHKNTMSNEGKVIPTRKYLVSKIDDINSIIHHRFTAEELQRKLERAGIHEKRNNTVKRLTLRSRRKAAIDNDDEDQVAECDAKLAALDGPKLRYGTTLEDPKPAAPTPPPPPTQEEQERLAERDRRVERYSDEIRRAEREERKERRRQREAIARGEEEPDSMARIKTTFRTFYDINESLEDRRARERDESRGVSRSASRPATPKSQESPKPSPERKRSPRKIIMVNGWPEEEEDPDLDLLDSLDFEINIEDL